MDVCRRASILSNGAGWGPKTSGGLSIRTSENSRALIHFDDEHGLVLSAPPLATDDDDPGEEDGFLIHIDSWGFAAPRYPPVVRVRAQTRAAAHRKLAGAALLSYDDSEGCPDILLVIARAEAAIAAVRH